jgi:hypothetical protein
MIFHQQLREFMKDHPDLTALTEKDLGALETTCSSEEMDQRANDQTPALRQQSANSIASFELPTHPTDDVGYSANAI